MEVSRNFLAQHLLEACFWGQTPSDAAKAFQDPLEEVAAQVEEGKLELASHCQSPKQEVQEPGREDKEHMENLEQQHVAEAP